MLNESLLERAHKEFQVISGQSFGTVTADIHGALDALAIAPGQLNERLMRYFNVDSATKAWQQLLHYGALEFIPGIDPDEASLYLPHIPGLLWQDFAGTLADELGDPVRVVLDANSIGKQKTAVLNGAANTFWSTPDSAATSQTGTAEEVALVYLQRTTGTTQNISAKWHTAGNQRSWQWHIDTSGRVTIQTSTNGTDVVTTACTIAITGVVNPSRWVWLKRNFVPNDGAGNRVLTVSYSFDPISTDPALVSWTVLETVTTAGATSIFDSTAALTIGANANANARLTGRVGRYTLTGGTDFNPANYTSGNTFSSGGATWTRNGQAFIAGDGVHRVASSDAVRPQVARVPAVVGVRNELVATDTLSTQSVTVTAAQRTLSFRGNGTVTLSGASTAGPLIGTGVNDIVSLTFTPTAGPLTLTVSGTVNDAQLELGAARTSYQSVGAGRYDITQSGIPSVPCLFRGTSLTLFTESLLPAVSGGSIIVAGDKGIWSDSLTFAGGTFAWGPTTYTGGPAGLYADVVGQYDFGGFWSATALTTAQELAVVRYFKAAGSPVLWEQEANTLTGNNSNFATGLGNWAATGVATLTNPSEEAAVTNSSNNADGAFISSRPTVASEIYIIRARARVSASSARFRAVRSDSPFSTLTDASFSNTTSASISATLVAASAVTSIGVVPFQGNVAQVVTFDDVELRRLNPNPNP